MGRKTRYKLQEKEAAYWKAVALTVGAPGIHSFFFLVINNHALQFKIACDDGPALGTAM